MIYSRICFAAKITLAVVLFIVASKSNIFAQDTYWQQEVNYTINVKLNDVKHELIADEKIEYINNSPQPLHYIYIHLWANAYKNKHTALAKQLLENGEVDFQFSKKEDRGYIDQLDFKVNDQPVKWYVLKDSIDICKIILSNTLEPGQKITITTPFHVKLPSSLFSRLGHIDQSYQITQWYPKPAVYDKNGWNPIPYLNLGEFYSEYGSYDVSITLPKNYVVGATGDLVNGDAEYNWMEEKSKQQKRRGSNKFPKSDAETKTLHYHQSKVHDFAWFADKRFLVEKSAVELPNSKNTVTTWALFTPKNADTWQGSSDYINKAIYYYSLWNGDYPYNQCTAVDGTISAGGGMEYPNVTVISEGENPQTLDNVIAHEVGHNWFYGILGSNERYDGWMDEGINSFNELRYMQTRYPQMDLLGKFLNGAQNFKRIFDIAKYTTKDAYYLSSQVSSRLNIDQAITTNSFDFTDFNYGVIMYHKTAASFNYLKSYLGAELFDRCMRTYFETWKFKHPQPADLRKIIEQTSHKNLSWFFDDLLASTKNIDYKIAKANKQGEVTIKNKGAIPSPLKIDALDVSNNLISSTWVEGFKGKQKINTGVTNAYKFIIDNSKDMPDTYLKNNTIRTSGIFKKVEPFRLQFLGSVENRDKTQFFYTPVVGWNAYNGLQTGMAFYNYILPEKKLSFMIMPMYAWGSKTITGSSEIAYNIYPYKLFENIRIAVAGKTYGYNSYSFLNDHFNNSYYKVAPQLILTFKNIKARSKVTNTLSLIYHIQSIHYVNPLFDVNGQLSDYEKGYRSMNIAELKFEHKNNKTLIPYSFTADVQNYNTAYRLSVEGNFKWRYSKKKKAIAIRVFAGKLLGNDLASKSAISFDPNGKNDYLFNYTLLARNNQSNWIANNQTVLNDGAFKNIVLATRSSNFLLANNIQIDVPALPLALYSDIGLTQNAIINQLGYITYGNKTIINTGVALIIYPHIAEVYFPIWSNSTPNLLNYQQRIRFVLNFDLLNPFKKLKSTILNSI